MYLQLFKILHVSVTCLLNTGVVHLDELLVPFPSCLFFLLIDTKWKLQVLNVLKVHCYSNLLCVGDVDKRYGVMIGLCFSHLRDFRGC